MSRLVLLEVAMKTDFPDLYDLYFGGQVQTVYYDKHPFMLVGTTSRLTDEAKLEILLGCPQLKAYFKELFGLELRVYVTSEKAFNSIGSFAARLFARKQSALATS